MKAQDKLLCDTYFHLFFKDEQGLHLFKTDQDYLHFLQLFFTYISPIADVYSYCLLPNQLHFVLKTKTEKAVFTFLKIEGRFPDETITLEEIHTLSAKSEFQNHNILSIHMQKQMASFFTTYALKLQQENLSKKKIHLPYEQALLISNDEVKTCIIHLHSLALQQGHTKELSVWRYTSFNAIISDKPTKLMRKEVIDIFGSKDNFIKQHQLEINRTV